MRRMVDDAGHLLPYRAAVEGWLEENHPPAEAYVAAAHHLAEPGAVTA